MSKVGKKHQKALDEVSKKITASAGAIGWQEALEAIVQTAHAKFDETVGADIVLGIDATKGEQTVRGSVLLPHGTGKTVRVVVFAKGEHEEAAVAAGADHVGLDELIEKIKGGWMEFDAAVATPDVMGKVGQVAKILGPRGLLPNARIGTVTFDVASIVNDLRKGRLSYRNDKSGMVHVGFGKVSFGPQKLLENLTALINAIRSSKPATSKGKYFKKITVSSTMGPGVAVNPDAVS